RVADIVDLAAGDAAFVRDDLHQGRDPVVDIGERALLCSAVDQLYPLAADDVPEELGDNPRASFLGLRDRVETSPDPVERAEQRVVETFLQAVSMDDTVHQLLRAG